MQDYQDEKDFDERMGYSKNEMREKFGLHVSVFHGIHIFVGDGVGNLVTIS
jgi:hypothetical protein